METLLYGEEIKMNPITRFQGTHFIDMRRLTSQNGGFQIISDITFGPNAYWKAAGSFDNVNIMDLGAGKSEYDEIIQQKMSQFALLNNVEIDSFYSFSTKTVPEKNRVLNAEEFATEYINGEWRRVPNTPDDKTKMNEDELAKEIQKLHNPGRARGYGGFISPNLFDKLCNKLGLENPFTRNQG
jgi:hypothetical protein